MSDPVFVFGSNLSGLHGKGAALFAKEHRGALQGVGEGHEGNSYAIPTKGLWDQRTRRLPVLSLVEIKSYVTTFIQYARCRPDLNFQLTPIGCGLAGFKHYQIAPMFAGVSSNVMIPLEFEGIIQQIIGGR